MALTDRLSSFASLGRYAAVERTRLTDTWLVAVLTAAADAACHTSPVRR